MKIIGKHMDKFLSWFPYVKSQTSWFPVNYKLRITDKLLLFCGTLVCVGVGVGVGVGGWGGGRGFFRHFLLSSFLGPHSTLNFTITTYFTQFCPSKLL